MFKHISAIAMVSVLFILGLSSVTEASSRSLRIAVTGDLHSHFDPHTAWGGFMEFERGGYARLATALKRERNFSLSKNTPFIYIDAGDSTEGDLLFINGNVGAGEASWKALELLNPNDDKSFMATALGNHDWLVGPYELERVLREVKPAFPILAGNLNFDDRRVSDPANRVESALDRFTNYDSLPFPEDYLDYTSMFLSLLLTGFDLPNRVETEEESLRVQSALESMIELLAYFINLAEENGSAALLAKSSEELAEIIRNAISSGSLKKFTKVSNSALLSEARTLAVNMVEDPPLGEDQEEPDAVSDLLPSVNKGLEFLKELINITPNFRDLLTPISLQDNLRVVLNRYKTALAGAGITTFLPDPYESAFLLRLFVTGSDAHGSLSLYSEDKFRDEFSLFLDSIRDTPWYKDRTFIPPNIASVETFINPENRNSVLDYFGGFISWLRDNNIPELFDLSSSPLIVDTTALRAGDMVVCLLGIVTNSREYEYFISPVKIDPSFPTPGSSEVSTVNRLLRTLKGSRACDLIGAVTHMEDHSDLKLLERADEGIDFVVGGHEHTYWHNPPLWIANEKSGRKIPIFKSGKHGEALITFDLTLNVDEATGSRTVDYTRFNTVEITSDIPEDTAMAIFLGEAKREIIGKLGFDPFNNILCRSDISLENLGRVESPFSNFVADALRDTFRDDEVDIVFVSPFFLQGDLPTRTDITSAYLFHVLSLIYNFERRSTWDIYTVELGGDTILNLLEVVFGEGHIISVDRNVRINYDPSDAISPFRSLEINKNDKWERALPGKKYTVAIPEGVLQGLYALNQINSEVFANRKKQNTNLWRIVSNKLSDMKTLKKGDAGIGQRLQPKQADLALFRQDVDISIQSNGELLVKALVHNNGGEVSSPKATLLVQIDTTPKKLSDNPLLRFEPIAPHGMGDGTPRSERFRLDYALYDQGRLQLDSMKIVAAYPLGIEIAPGESKNISFIVNAEFLGRVIKSSGSYPVEILLREGSDSWVTENNRVESALFVP